jgi:chromosome segregation ATPase
MNTQPTPETHAMVSADQHHLEDDNFFPASIYWRMCDLARTLERERDEARFDLDFRRRLGDLQNKTIDDLTKQRDEAREYADKLAEGLPEGMLPKDVEVLREANLGLATNIAAVTEQRDDVTLRLGNTQERMIDAERQRDRLAEALANLVKANETWNQGIMDVMGRPPNWNDSYLNAAKQALQTLTPKS